MKTTPLAQLRHRAGLSQTEVADALGLTHGAVSHLEHGKRGLTEYGPVLVRTECDHCGSGVEWEGRVSRTSLLARLYGVSAGEVERAAMESGSES